MRTKNSRPITPAEAEHLAAVKELPCSVCDRFGPSDAHHIRQGDHWTVIALCWDCHQGSGGIHGDKSNWLLRKMDELDALQVTYQRLNQQEPHIGSRQNSARSPAKIIPRQMPHNEEVK